MGTGVYAGEFEGIKRWSRASEDPPLTCSVPMPLEYRNHGKLGTRS